MTSVVSGTGTSCAAPLRLTLSLALVVLAAGGCRQPPPAPPPSVLLIVVDTLRPDHLGLHGHLRDTTPLLDRRATSAAIFERAFSTSSWTLPAVASILTGELPPVHGARARDRDGGERSGDDGSAASIVRGAKTFSRLRDGVPTLAEALADRGYATAAVTSNPFLDPRFGLDRGFASYDQRPRRRAAAVTDSALSWLAAQPEAPFFLLVHYMDPHLPYRPPADHRGRFTAAIEGSELDYSLAGVQSVRRTLADLSAADRDFLAAAYDEEIAYLDGELERLFAGLEGLGRWRDTLAVLTSDHGEEFFEHGGFEHGHALYDEVLRVPLLVWGEGVTPGRRDQPISLADIAPTVLEAIDEVGDGERRSTMTSTAGSSFWPTLVGRKAAGSRVLLAENLLHGRDQLAAIEWPHKVIVEVASERLEVFDLAADPAEKRNLHASVPAAARRLLARARAAAGRAADTSQAVELDDATRDDLRALGYVN